MHGLGMRSKYEDAKKQEVTYVRHQDTETPTSFGMTNREDKRRQTRKKRGAYQERCVTETATQYQNVSWRKRNKKTKIWKQPTT